MNIPTYIYLYLYDLYISIYIYIYKKSFRIIALHKQKENEILYSQKRDTPMYYINDGNAFLWSNDIEGE